MNVMQVYQILYCEDQAGRWTIRNEDATTHTHTERETVTETQTQTETRG